MSGTAVHVGTFVPHGALTRFADRFRFWSGNLPHVAPGVCPGRVLRDTNRASPHRSGTQDIQGIKRVSPPDPALTKRDNCGIEHGIE